LLFFLFPKGKILLKKLDDGFSISEGFLIYIVDLFKSIRQSLFSKFTGLLVVVHNFIVEHREVQGKSQSNWVAGIQSLGSSLSLCVVFKSTIFDSVKLITLSALGNISVVVTDHLVEEGFGLISGGNLHAG